MPRLLIDAGPLIAVFHHNDGKHAYCLDRFNFLIASTYRLLITFPVLCEVHKLVQKYTTSMIAQRTLFDTRRVA